MSLDWEESGVLRENAESMHGETLLLGNSVNQHATTHKQVQQHQYQGIQTNM